MAKLNFGADTFSSLGGAVDTLFGAAGAMKTAKGLKEAASLARLNKSLSEQSTQIQQLQADREIYRVLGGQKADFAGAGLALSGSALDVIRASEQEASLTKSLISMQGQIDALGYEQQAVSYESQAKASKKGGIGGFLKGAFGIASTAASVFALSDDRMKQDIRLLRRLPNGVGVFQFRYIGQPTLWEGLMASDVSVTMPKALKQGDDGLYMVDYDRVGFEPREIA